MPYPQEASLRRAFLVWVKHVLAKKKAFAPYLKDISELSEVHEMLSSRLDKWDALRDAQRDAQRDLEILAKGIEKGIEKGIGKGECLVLQRQMAKRFGHLPEWALRRLE